MKQLVENGNFSKGNAGFGSDYTFVDGKPGSQPDVQPSYDIDKSPVHAANAWPDWAGFGDHTTGHGKMMLVNGGTGDVWHEDIALTAGKTYTFSLWAREIDDGSSGLGDPPQVQFLADGQAIGTALTVQGPDSEGWQQLTFTYTPTTTTGTISIQDLNADSAYNDFALDDISITKASRAVSAEHDADDRHADAHVAHAESPHLFDHPAF